MTICTNGLGLRSAESTVDLSGASYALDDGRAYVFRAEGPSDWGTKLDATLDKILEYGNATGRHLLLVKFVTGTSRDYVDCFMKCSSSGQTVVSSIELGGQTRSALASWVMSNIR